MSQSPHSSTEAHKRYAAWERQAAVTCAVLLALVGASFFFQIPSVAFAACSVIAGVLAFFVWRVTLVARMNAALVFALLAVTSTLLALAFELSEQIEPLLVQAVGFQALALFACILFARPKQKSP